MLVERVTNAEAEVKIDRNLPHRQDCAWINHRCGINCHGFWVAAAAFSSC